MSKIETARSAAAKRGRGPSYLVLCFFSLFFLSLPFSYLHGRKGRNTQCTGKWKGARCPLGSGFWGLGSEFILYILDYFDWRTALRCGGNAPLLISGILYSILMTQFMTRYTQWSHPQSFKCICKVVIIAGVSLCSCSPGGGRDWTLSVQDSFSLPRETGVTQHGIVCKVSAGSSARLCLFLFQARELCSTHPGEFHSSSEKYPPVASMGQLIKWRNCGSRQASTSRRMRMPQSPIHQESRRWCRMTA